MSEQIQAGMIGLNRGAVSDPAAPFGGMKQSGLGREGSTEGIYEFCETQYIATELVAPERSRSCHAHHRVPRCGDERDRSGLDNQQVQHAPRSTVMPFYAA